MQIAKVKSWVKLLATIVVAVTMLLGTPQDAKAASNPPVPIICPVTEPTVIFRLDDIQPYYLEPTQLEIMRTFEARGVALTIGVITRSLVKSPHSDALYSIMSNLGEKGEVACHSKTHPNFTSLSLNEQKDELSDCRDKLMTLFPGKEINTFIPPYNEFNDDTLEAMREESYSILSSQSTNYSIPNGSCYNECGNFDDEDDIVDLPMGASTGGYGSTLVLQSAQTVFDQINNQLDDNGQNWSVVMMHPQEFSTGKEVNLDAIATLNELIDMCESSGYEMVTFSQLKDSVDS
jgi:peptidoglycan/xylan/chitin deacetylase (PgdA/CDA1 family)